MKKLGPAIILVLLVAILAGGVVFFIRQTSAPNYAIEITLPTPYQLPAPYQEIKVYVSGEVQNPGIYVLSADARVSDAIEAAGGFTPEADRDAINLTRLLRDGAQVHVFHADEVPQRININTADAWLLRALPGIGEVRAARIIENRPFKSIEELKELIPPEVYEGIRDKVVVGEGEVPQRVNINTADAWLLDALPGIGDILAARIIERRPFECIEELKELMRLETFERIRDKITVH
jgi:competence protein ComEA